MRTERSEVSSPKAIVSGFDLSGYDDLHVFDINLVAKLWYCSEHVVDLEEAQESKITPYILKLEAGIQNGQLEMEFLHQDLLSKDGIIRLTRFNLMHFFRTFQIDLPDFLLSAGARDLKYDVQRVVKAKAGTGAGNSFKRLGDGWLVSMEDAETVIIKDSIGMSYIHQLLKTPYNPHDKTHVVQHYYSVFPAPAIQSSSKEFSKMDSETQKALGMSARVSFSGGGEMAKMVDPKTIKQVRARKKEIQEELNQLLPNQNEELEISLTGELFGLDHYLNMVTDRNGNIRKDQQIEGKIRISFQKAVKASIDNIRKSSPFIADHLSKSITCGWNPFYLPPYQMDWTL
jgi:hypothetical protein